jgi:hypothetical protein
LIIKNTLDSTTSNNLVVDNKGLLYSKDVLSISADRLNNKKNIVANKVTLDVDTSVNNQANARILADEQLIIKQTVSVLPTKLLEVINAGLLALRSSLNITSFVVHCQQLIGWSIIGLLDGQLTVSRNLSIVFII